MIQRAFLAAWRARAPWSTDAQVEQDLVVTRALVELFGDPVVQSSVAFRGGTALHKLFLPKPERYSEDIDLVQCEAGPIGPVMNAMRRRLDPWLGKPQWKQGKGRATLYYRFTTEIGPVVASRLKIEINTREHFSVLGFARRPLVAENPWFSGAADIATYHLDEILGTKLRALYQRKKGRDLFDLWAARRQAEVDPHRVVECFHGYVENDGVRISRAEFEANLIRKRGDRGFASDIEPLLAGGVAWDPHAATEYVMRELVSRLRGEPWRGRE